MGCLGQGIISIVGLIIAFWFFANIETALPMLIMVVAIVVIVFIIVSGIRDTKENTTSYASMMKKEEPVKNDMSVETKTDEEPDWQKEAERIKLKLRMEEYRLTNKEDTTCEQYYAAFVNDGRYKVQKNGLNELLLENYLGEEKAILTIPKEIDGMPVRVIGSYAFRDCVNIEKVIIPAGIKEIHDGAFYGCSKLREVILPYTLKSLGEDCRLPRTGLVTKGVFQNCALESIVIPSAVTILGEKAFSGCTNLSMIVVLNNVEYIGVECFQGTALKEFNFPERLKVIETGVFANSKLIRVELPDSVEEIKANAFSGCKDLKEVVIPDSVKYIADNAFSECDNVILHCYPSSCGFEYARANNFANKDVTKKR